MENIIYKKTTKEHFEKFRDMANEAGISFKRSKEYMGFTKEQLLKLYIEDNNLNNIPLIEFDSYYLVLPNCVRKIVTNFADNCCLYKHLLIYEVLGIIPVFTNNGY